MIEDYYVHLEDLSFAYFLCLMDDARRTNKSVRKIAISNFHFGGEANSEETTFS